MMKIPNMKASIPGGMHCRSNWKRLRLNWKDTRTFDPTEMKTAGCYVTISGDGKIRIQKGLVRPQGQEGRGERERRAANGCGHGR